MKVLHFASSYLPVPGGGTVRLQQLLAGSDIEHTLVVPQAPSAYVPNGVPSMPDGETMDGVRVRRLRMQPQPKPWIPLLSRLHAMRRDACGLAALSGLPAADIVHGHTPAEFAWGGLRYARRRDLPYLCEFHRLWFALPQQRHPLVPGALYDLNRAALLHLDRRLARRADLVLTQCQGYYDLLVKEVRVPPQRLALVPISVDGSRFDPDAQAVAGEALRSSLQADNRVVLLYSGYMAAATGTGFLLRALQGISPEVRRRLLVVFAGRGPLQGEVQAFAREHSDWVRWLGLLAFDQMPALYAASDALLLPLPGQSWAELGPPIKLLEGMAMRKLVLASDVAGITEVMRPGASGLAYAKDDEDDLRRALAQVANDFADYDSLRHQAREDVLRTHAQHHAREQLKQVYARLLGGAEETI